MGIGKSSADARNLLAEILRDAVGDAEQLWALHQRFEALRYPLHGFMLGDPVLVTAIQYDGNSRRGLTASCQKLNGEGYVVGLADVELLEGSDAAQYLAAYREWLGVDSGRNSRDIRTALRRGKSVEGEGLATLIVLAVKDRLARCRFIDKARQVTLHAQKYWRLVPGELLTVQTRKMWHDLGHLHLRGDMVQSRVDAAALGLSPLQLSERGIWDPAAECWVKEWGPLPDWVEGIKHAGPRSAYELERSSSARNGAHEEAIERSVELKEAGHVEAAERVLMGITECELRQLDAHAHLGNLEFERHPDKALRHFEVGMRIAELGFPKDFNGVLPWSWTNNRPYLRCLHGYGLTLWRLGRQQEAGRTVERMLRLNPNDNQGARFLLQDIRGGKQWAEAASAGSGPSSRPAWSGSCVKKNVAAGSVDRATALIKQMRLADDLDKKWRVDDLLEALQPAGKTRNALARFWEWEKTELVSLQDLMDLAIAEEVDPRPGYLVTRLLDLRCVGVNGFWSVVDRLTALNLGAQCNAEWNRRLVKLKGCWRMRGVTQTWSKPCARPPDT